MSRQKLSEFRAKNIICQAIGLPYKGWSVDAQVPLRPQLEGLPDEGTFVVKVDEGVKGRFKKGLVELNVKPKDIDDAISSLKDKGYSHFIVEPMVSHDQAAERYMSLIYERDGVWLQYSASGGVDIEKQADSLRRVKVDESVDWDYLAGETGFSADNLKDLVTAFKRDYFVFLEINPYLTGEDGLKLLDAAVEVDDAAEFFVDDWQAADFRRHTSQGLTDEEKTIQELDANSPASLKLSVLEPDGSIFLLLSGGGASVVVADEIYNQGYGKQLANYGEYSGNPNAEETHLYTKAVLQLLLKSQAKHKVVFIGGAVANFTDVGKTFAGVIKAIDEAAAKLREQRVKVFVRRGGPNQETGLANIEAALERHGLLGAVHSPATPLTAAVQEALQEVPRE